MLPITKAFTVTKISVSNVPELHAALAEVAKIRAAGAGQPITIQLTDGDYYLSDTIRIGAEVSAVTIEPEHDGKVRIIGGVRVTDFVEDTYNGTACLSAPIPKAADGSFLKASDLYINGTRADYTRYPEEGYLYPTDVENKEGQLFSGSHWFIAAPGDFPTGMKNPEQVIVSYCHYWIDEHSPIAAYDEETGKVTFAYCSRFNIAGGKGTSSGLEYYLENVAETFGKPNQWYMDEGRLYYVPRDASIMPDTIDAYLPTVHELFDISGTAEKPVANIIIRGIKMSVTKGDYGSLGSTSGLREAEQYASDPQAVSNAGGSIRFAYATDCSIENAYLTNYGLHGVSIENGCSGIRVSHVTFRDGGAGGVRMVGGVYGTPMAEQTHDCIVEDCVIDHCGRRYFAACGVLMMHTWRCIVDHCDIGNLYYTGVSCGWIWGYGDNNAHDNRITKNHIHHLGMGMLSDMGGVYLLGKQPGTIVSGNVIHDVYSKNYGGWALYTDEGSSFMTLEDNVCYNTSENAFHQHYGSMNTVRNNILALGDEAILRVSRPEEHVSMLVENNIFYTNGSPLYRLENGHIDNKTVITRNNIFWDTTGTYSFCKNMPLTEAQEKGMDTGSVIVDPGFVDPKNGDFTLPADSPVFSHGFKPIDTSDVGVRAR